MPLSAEHRARIAWSKRRTHEIEAQFKGASRAAWNALAVCELVLQRYENDGLANFALEQAEKAWDRLTAAGLDARILLEELGVEIPERHLKTE